MMLTRRGDDGDGDDRRGDDRRGDDRRGDSVRAWCRRLVALIGALAPGDERALRAGLQLMAGWPAVCAARIEVAADRPGGAALRVHAGTPWPQAAMSRLRVDLHDPDLRDPAKRAPGGTGEGVIGTLTVALDATQMIEPELPRVCETAAVLLGDVVARMRLQAALLDAQAYAGAGRIAVGLVHDFNNMLTGIIGNVAVLRLVLPEEERTAVPVARIEEAATSAAHLARALLNFVRGAMERERLSVNDVATATRGLLSRAIRDGVSVTLDLAPDVPEIDGEQPLLQHALVNLVLNAVEAIEGEGSVTIRTCRAAAVPETALGEASAAASYAVLSVTDTGSGIRADQIADVFRPFFSTKGDAGTGLGLASVAQVARRHGGAVGVESPRGLGATFAIYLPASAADRADRADRGGRIDGGAPDEPPSRRPPRPRRLAG